MSEPAASAVSSTSCSCACSTWRRATSFGRTAPTSRRRSSTDRGHRAPVARSVVARSVLAWSVREGRLRQGSRCLARLWVLAALLVAFAPLGCASYSEGTKGARTALDHGKPDDALKLYNEKLEVSS